MSRFYRSIGLAFILLTFTYGVAQSAESISIPCRDEKGTIFNAKESEVCRSILPLCSKLRENLIDSMKNMISWKIYGYYHLNKDIDLNQELTNPASLKGEPLPYPVCSVVGQKVSGGTDLGEINKQSIGQQLSCGEYPIILHKSTDNTKGYQSTIHYSGERGKRWFSWVQGALPWELRRSAYDINNKLDANLTNLGEVLSNSAMNDALKDKLQYIRKRVLELSGQAKAACHSSSEDILKDCQTSEKLSLTDPVNRVCTLAKAQLALNSLAAPNMLVFEAMDRARTYHERYFQYAFVASGENPNGTMGEFSHLVKYCSDNSSLNGFLSTVLNFWPFRQIFRWIRANKSYSCFTSCMLDGTEYYTNVQNNKESWKNSGGARRRKCQKKSAFSLETGKPITLYWQSFAEGLSLRIWKVTYRSGSGDFVKDLASSLPAKRTNNHGFAGMVEKVIRKDICLQNKKTDPSICDEIGIPDVPTNLNGGGK
jgi:hypothetical protein